MLLRLLVKKCPEQKYHQGPNVGYAEVDYFLYRNHLPVERREQPIYHIYCDIFLPDDDAFQKDWFISEDTLSTEGERVLFQIIQESGRYTDIPNRIFI